ncbi:glycosyltransferase [bacterium]|nr:glycosyltransferase [bacterium]MBU1074235.1 glycosyltransferase [bacterium]MBU1674780.1 glycosyltransferase [bacterium]
MRLAFLSIGRHIHTERWILWFAERGHECHLLTVQPGEIPGVAVHDIRAGSGPKPLRYAFSLRRVKTLLRDIGPDLLNTHFLTGYGYWGHFSGFHPNVLTVWGDDIYLTPHENALKRWLAERALRSCDALTGDSTDILAAAAAMGARPDRAFRVLWGVDFARFRPGSAAAWRRAQGFADDHLLYFSPRSFTQPYYNIDVVIEAAARVMSREPRARFLFSGYEGDPAPFWASAEEAGIAGVAKFLGRIPHEEFATALNAADVFISVPSVDATAVSLLEAMACGDAIVVSSLPSSVEWIRDGVSGLVVEPRDAGGLARALLRFAADADLRRACGEAALATARREAGFGQNMQHVDDIFRCLAGTGGSWPVSVVLPGLQARGGRS